MALASLIVLAAGSSARVGTPKGLIVKKNSFSGEHTWLEEQMRSYQQAGGRVVVLVLGEHAAEYEKRIGFKLGQWQEIWGLWLKPMINEKWQQGPFSSLQLGFSTLPELTDVCVLPIDVPLAKRETLQWLQLLHEQMTQKTPDHKVTLPEFKSQGGHPVWLSTRLRKYILEQDPSSRFSRLDYVIKKLKAEEVLRVPVEDDRVILNLNTPQDWQNYFA